MKCKEGHEMRLKETFVNENGNLVEWYVCHKCCVSASIEHENLVDKETWYES